MRRPLLWLGLLAPAVCLAADSLPSWKVVRCSQPPIIDGKLDDPCWSEQTLVSNFRNVLTGDVARVQTRFCVLYDDNNLYFAIHCDEPDMAGLRANLQAHDDSLWTDDCVELLLDPTNQRESYVHLIINPYGAVYDAWVSAQGTRMDMDFDCGAEAAAVRFEGGWAVELRVPFAGLRLTRKAGGTWGFNLCRQRKPAPAELSCWSPTFREGFHHPDRLGTLTGLPPGYRIYLLSLARPRFLEPHFEEKQLAGTLAIPFENHTERTLVTRLRAAFSGPDTRRMENVVHVSFPRGRGIVKVPVVVGTPGRLTLQLEVWQRDPERLLSLGRYPMRLEHQPVDVSFQYPWYRDTLYSSLRSQEIVCRLKVNALRHELADCELRVTLNSGAVELSARRVRLQKGSGEAEVRFSAGIIPAGEYVVKAQAIRRGEVIAEGQRGLRKLRPAAHEVILDAAGRLLVDGRPFFPWGFMGADLDERLPRAGFNTIHNYNTWYIHRDADLRAWLDKARDLGLKVVLPPFPGETDSFGFRGDAEVTVEELAEIRAYVEQYRDHPAVLAWYMCDEPRGAVWRASLERVYDVVAQADPYHPCVALDNHPSTLVGLDRVGDILWIDPYPGFARGGGPKQPLSEVGRVVAEVVANLLPGRPLWVAPQAFSYAEWDRELEAKERQPSFVEARCMNYLALLNGARGIIPFAWAYAQRHPSLRVGYLENLGPEMAILLPALAGGEWVAGCRAVPRSPGAEVQVGAWKHEDSFYIVAVNPEPEEARARLVIPGLGGRWVKALAEERRIKALNGTLDEWFGPYQVHVYCDRKKLPSLTPLELVQAQIAREEAQERQ